MRTLNQRFGRLIENSKADDINLGPRVRDAYLLVLYVVFAMVFLYVVLLNRRDYQDLWILDGIALPTILFVCFSFVVDIARMCVPKMVKNGFNSVFRF
jgi:hypothetical protein